MRAQRFDLEFGGSDAKSKWVAEQRRRLKVKGGLRRPQLDSDQDRMLANFRALNRTRIPAFEGIGVIDITAMCALYDAENWWEAEITVLEYIDLMLALDDTTRQFIEERTPSK